MTTLASFGYGLAAMCVSGTLLWLVSLAKRNVSIVDSLWSLMFLIGAIVYAGGAPESAPRVTLVLALTALWAVRLSAYITWRNWGEGEDHRYQAMRANRPETFPYRSLVTVFYLQAVLASLVALPLLAAIRGTAPLGLLDYAGIGLWVFGMYFEVVGDAQLARFKADPANKGQVLDTGLWRYTRHPNYFGEFCLWWGFYLIAAGAGGWWSVPGPLLISVLLLKVSGVTLLEKDISERRPAYRDYIEKTNAFFPGPPRNPAARTGELSQ